MKLDFRVTQLCTVSKRYQGITGHRGLKKVEQANEKQQCWYIYSNNKVHIKGIITPAI